MNRVFKAVLGCALGLLLLLLLCACGKQAPLDAARKAAAAGRDIDFAALQAENPDIVAWLYIPGTAINEPILRSTEDPLFYGSHACDGREDSLGALFVQASHSDAALSDAVTVVYGTSTAPQAPFVGLQTAFCENNALTTHSPLCLYTPAGRSAWQVFGLSVWGDKHISAAYRDFHNRLDLERFVEAVRNYRTMTRLFDDSVSVSAQDRLLVLSAHIPGSPEERFLVLSKLIETK